jgi:hypothetical protein
VITFVCWKWKQENYGIVYTAEHANIWRAMIARHYKPDHRAICITDDPEGVTFETFPLWRDCDGIENPSGAHYPSCYRRLKIFSPITTREMGIDENSEVVSMDLDVVIVADIAPLFERYPIEDFVGWRDIGSYRPAAYNGSLFKFRSGKLNYLWDDFDPAISPVLASKAGYVGSDQGWISYRIAGRAPGWRAQDGVLSYTTNLRIRGGRSVLPYNARVVSFDGKRKPWEPELQAASPWILERWRL